MIEQKAYYTLKQLGEAEFVERKSRFLGFAAPVQSEEDALSLLQSIKTTHKTATHHCYAYIIGSNAGLMRYQDDGEPQGTAGVPILEVLKKNSVVNCLCIVTRYYGGIQLGAGGLMRAYTKAAAMAIKYAGIVIAYQSVRLSTKISYFQWDRVNHALESLPLCEIERQFGSEVGLSVTIKETDLDLILETINSLTEGSVKISISNPFFWLWEKNQPTNKSS
jgi:uncharacterized YigZ family protein